MKKLKLLAFASMLALLTMFNPCFGDMAKLTAFNDHERDSRPYGALNCQGTRLEVGQCAADLKYHKLGERVAIQGMGVYTVSDCGSDIKGKNRYDIYVSSLKEVSNFGVKYRDVTEIGKEKMKEVIKSTSVCNTPTPNKELVYSSKRCTSHSITVNKDVGVMLASD